MALANFIVHFVSLASSSEEEAQKMKKLWKKRRRQNNIMAVSLNVPRFKVCVYSL